MRNPSASLILRSEAWNQAGPLIAVSWLEKLTTIDFPRKLVHPTWLICNRTRRQTRCGTISETLTFMSLGLWNPLITWKLDLKYKVIPRQMLPCNQGLIFTHFISFLLHWNPAVKFTCDTCAVGHPRSRVFNCFQFPDGLQNKR